MSESAENPVGLVDLTPSLGAIERRHSGGPRDRKAFPVPLWKARDVLLEALTLRAEHFFRGRAWERGSEGDGKTTATSAASAICAGPQVFSLRLEVLVDTEELGDGQDGPLSWLGAQSTPNPAAPEDPTLPRVFLRTPRGGSSCGSGDANVDGQNEEEKEEDDETFAAAGLGAMHLLTGGGRLEDDAWADASSAGPWMRYYGGARFKPLAAGSASVAAEEERNPSPQWRAYGGHWLVLPLVELSSGGQSGNDPYEGRGLPIRQRRQPTLAVNLRWTSSEGSTPEANPAREIGHGQATASSAKSMGGAAGHVGQRRVTFASARARAIQALERVVCCYARPGAEGELPLPILKDGERLDDPVMNTQGEEYRRWERGVERALDSIRDGRYSKVTLARTARLQFHVRLSPVEVLRRLRDHHGFLFCLQPNANTAFLGCTPERLFLSKGSVVVTEALAGTRPRGDSHAEDERLGSELLASEKDMLENSITAEYISAALRRAGAVDLHCTEAFLKRLTHVQHICRRITATMAPAPTPEDDNDGTPSVAAASPTDPAASGEPRHAAAPTNAAVDTGRMGHDPSDHQPPEASSSIGQLRTERRAISGEDLDGVGSGVRREGPGTVAAAGRALLEEMHPTPAVCGKPRDATYAAIGEVEGFDRGFYAGPVGYISARGSEFGVAIRSALVTEAETNPYGGVPANSQMELFAGCGIVPGSLMKNFLSLFPERPVNTLRDLPNMNSLWGALVVEELVRLGVRRFCVCPGSRSTPLAVAVARHPSAVATSHHDERGAGFFAIGFARAGTDGGGVCAIVTTSGTSVANLLPAAAEANTAGLPMLLLTADRPPEERGCGSNQTIDQVKLFGSRARLSVDIQCPSDSVHVSTLLSDVDRAVWKALGGGGAGGSVPGPVHLNFMFRENLAPDGGAVRDAGVPGLTSEWSDRCLESPSVSRWAADVEPFTRTVGWGFHEYGGGSFRGYPLELEQAVEGLVAARRGLLVLGSLRGPEERCAAQNIALTLRWPVYADVTSGLRSWAAEVGLGVGRLDQVLLDDALKGAISPDAVLQVGAPLISKRVQKLVSCPATALTARARVLCIPTGDWYDPDRAFTTRLACSVRELAVCVDRAAHRSNGEGPSRPGSELLRLVGISDAAERAQTASLAAALGPRGRSDTTDQDTRGRRRKQGQGPENATGDPYIGTFEGDTSEDAAISGDDRRRLDHSPAPTDEAPANKASDGASSSEGVRSAPADAYAEDPLVQTDGGHHLPPPQQDEGESLTDPFVSWCLSRDVCPQSGVFLSASMPCRDFDSFAHGTSGAAAAERGGRASFPCDNRGGGRRLRRVATNRGANGIDGVISSAMGYAAGLRTPVTLLIGDIATLHDLGSLHALRGLDASTCRVTVVCVNNSGGGIFSFLPIAEPRHADAFTPLLDTPHTVDFRGVCLSMGLAYRRASTPREFREAFLESQGTPARGEERKHFFIEAVTTSRPANAHLHRSLGQTGAAAALSHLLGDVRLGWEFTPASGASSETPPMSTSISTSASASAPSGSKSSATEGLARGRRLTNGKPTLLLLHGFMGSKSDWRGEFTNLATADGHAILNIELPWHGGSSSSSSSDDSESTWQRSHRKNHQDDEASCRVSWGLAGVELAAEAVLRVCDAVGAGPYLVVGYSMGGRIALALAGRRPDLLHGGGGVVLVSANPGLTSSHGRISRWGADCALASRIASLDGSRTDSAGLPPVASPSIQTDEASARRKFLEWWYSALLWGAIRRRRPQQYMTMLDRRLDLGLRRVAPTASSASSLQAFGGNGQRRRGATRSRGGERDLARGCLGMSVARQPDMWPLLRRLSEEERRFPVAYVAGELDCRYGHSGAPDPRQAAVLHGDVSPSPLPVQLHDGISGAAPVQANSGDRNSSRSSSSVAEAVTALCPAVTVTILPDCGHAVPTEAPGPLYREVALVAAAAAAATAALETSRSETTEQANRRSCDDRRSTGEKATSVRERENPGIGGGGGGGDTGVASPAGWNGVLCGVRITGFRLEEFSVPMTSPLKLSQCRLTERQGVLVRLEGEREETAAAVVPSSKLSESCGDGPGGRVWGVGEVTPLPGFHQETLEEVAKQLRATVPLLVNRVASFGAVAEALDQTLERRPPLLVLSEPRPPRQSSSEAGDVAVHIGKNGRRNLRAREGDKIDLDSISNASGADHEGGGARPPLSRLAAGTAFAASNDFLSTLLPSVRCGIEMALVHLVARASGTGIGPALGTAAGLSARNSIEINGLATRGEGLSIGQSGQVLKVKVGGRAGPASDAARTLELLQDSPRGSSVRLDANQAWTMDEALGFFAALAGADVEGPRCNGTEAPPSVRDEAPAAARTTASPATMAIEYIEEPLRDPRGLEELWERSGKAVPYALDESLAMGRGVFTDNELLGLKGCGAFVMKLSMVGGPSRAACLCRLANGLGVSPVLSSAFESGVGLAHAAIFASCFAAEGTTHGLSTYTRLDGDVASPGFADAVRGGATVDVIECQALLDCVADVNG